MEIFSVPGSGKYVCEGSIIELLHIPGIKYMVHRSNNNYHPTTCGGWYAESLVDTSKIPLTESDVANCKIIYNPDLNSCCPPPPPAGPPHGNCEHQHKAQSYTTEKLSVEERLVSHGDTVLGDSRSDSVNVKGTPNFETEVILSDKLPKIKSVGGSGDLKFEDQYGNDIVLYGVADPKGDNNAVNLRTLKSHLSKLAEELKKKIDQRVAKIRIGKQTLEMSEEGIVDIPVATQDQLGVVKSSDKDNRVSIDENGEMVINGISQDKIVQDEDDVMIFDCGTSVDII